jgi:hypothetical protein
MRKKLRNADRDKKQTNEVCREKQDNHYRIENDYPRIIKCLTFARIFLDSIPIVFF